MCQSPRILVIEEVMKLIIILYFVETALGCTPSSYEAEYLVEVKRQSANGNCTKAEDLKCPRCDVTFWLYTRKTQNSPTKLDQYNLSLLKYTPFVNAPLKFIIHGYANNKDNEINAALRPAYFSRGEYNIISVDWSPLGHRPCYYQTVMNVPTIAHCVAQFFNAVVRSHFFPSVHLMGHSMGVHIAAYASHEIENLPRLTEFEPPLRLFNLYNRLLVKGDAQFIDVYHSNAGFFGRCSPDGHVDVYFNDGTFQPGCGCEDFNCSHSRAYQYYAEGITRPNLMVSSSSRGLTDYIERRCPVAEPSDLVIVGEDINCKLRGTFFMFTNAEKPFLVDSTKYLDVASFTSLIDTADSNCYNNPNLKSCNFDIYCLSLRTLRS